MTFKTAYSLYITLKIDCELCVSSQRCNGILKGWISSQIRIQQKCVLQKLTLPIHCCLLSIILVFPSDSAIAPD